MSSLENLPGPPSARQQRRRSNRDQQIQGQGQGLGQGQSQSQGDHNYNHNHNHNHSYHNNQGTHSYSPAADRDYYNNNNQSNIHSPLVASNSNSNQHPFQGQGQGQSPTTSMVMGVQNDPFSTSGYQYQHQHQHQYQYNDGNVNMNMNMQMRMNYIDPYQNQSSAHVHEQAQRQQQQQQRQQRQQQRPQAPKMEKENEETSKSKSHSQSSSQLQFYNDKIELIILNSETRDHKSSSSSVFDHSKSKGNDNRNGNGNGTRKKEEAVFGKLTGEELNQLSLFCASSDNSTASASASTSASTKRECNWSDIDLDFVTTLSGLLEDHVRNALSIDLIQLGRQAFEDGDTKWFSTSSKSSSLSSLSPGRIQYMILKQGIQAATILLSIMITPDIDQRIISEDGIEGIIALMRKHLGRNVIGALGALGHTAVYQNNVSRSSSSRPTKRQKRETSQDGELNQSAKSKTSTPAKKGSQALIKFLKNIYASIASTVGLLTNLIERLDVLIRSVAIEDQPLLSICSCALSSLTIDPAASSNTGRGIGSNESMAQTIQTSCMSLVTTVFRRYPRHRIVVLEDLFPLFLKIPTSKKMIRTFAVRLGADVWLKRSKGSMCVRVDGVEANEGREQQAFIQVINALVLSMIQSCVIMPYKIQTSMEQKGEGEHDSDADYDTDEGMNNRQSPKKRKKNIARLTSGLQDCERICQIFVAKLIQRCSKKGGEGGASEFRPVLVNLVEDLLSVQMLPEFPAAEMLLMHICRKLCHDLVNNSAVYGRKQSSEATYLTTAMDTIGLISSDIVGKMSLAKESPLVFPKAVDIDTLDQNGDPSSGSPAEVNRCFCGRTTLVDTFMLDCDRCHNWFHGSCIGIAKDNLPDKWVCDECTMQKLVWNQMQLLSSKSKYGKEIANHDEKTDDLSNQDKIHVMRLLLLKFLSYQMRSTKTSIMKSSRQFHIAKFLEDLEAMRGKSNESILSGSTDMLCTYFLELWDCDNATMGRSDTVVSQHRQECEYLSDEGNAKLMLTLNSSKSELVSAFPRLLGVIVALMGGDNVGSLRKLAVKALSQIVQVDSSLMSTEQIRDAVAKRFNDEAISVREAAVSLVGYYVLQAPELAKSFHSPLLLRLNDNGVSVRKRVIKIFRDLISGNPKYPGRAAVFTKLLMQAANRKEDDGVRDLIHDTFLALWFANYKSFGRKSTSLAAVVTPQRDGNSGTGDTARQMIEVVSASSSPKHLTNLVQGMINGDGDNCEGKKKTQRKIDRVASEQYCASIVASLIEELLVFEEQRERYTQAEAGSQLNSLLTTICVFAEASPPLLLNHYETLLHYLKGGNGVTPRCESLVVSHVCKILSHVSNSLDDVDIQRLGRGDVANDLVNITYKFGISASGAAVEALAKLATHPHSDKDSPLMMSLVKLAKVFYSHLQKKKGTADDFSKGKSQERNNVHRALSVLGSICRHHDHEDLSSLDDDLENFVAVPPSSLTWENLPSASFVIFRKYLEKTDAGTKCKAIRAMAGIFSSHPRVMLAFEQEGSLSEIMSDDAHPTLQLESLQCLREILTTEEMRVESGEAKRKMETKADITTSKKISGDQDGDASLIGACCIQHAPRLYEMTSSLYPMVRMNAVLLIETLLRQGLLNPMELVPVLFALQGDLQQPSVRSLALKLLMGEAEKRPGMVRQLFAEGVRHCFQFQKKVYSNLGTITARLLDSSAQNGNDQIDCIFGHIFHESIRSSRTHTNRIIKSLLYVFSGDEQNDTREEVCSSENLSMLSFISEVIAFLPYNHLENVLYIVHQIIGIISVEGNDVMSRLTAFLRPYGLSSEDDDPNEEDKLERATRNKCPSKAKGISNITKQSFDFEKFRSLCVEASAMVLLLRLQSFLREAFSGVTMTRLIEYMPGAKERISDRAPNRISNITPFNSRIPLVSASESKSINLDNSIRQYAAFRKLMRAYDATQIVQSDSDGNRSDDTNGDILKRQRSNSDE